MRAQRCLSTLRRLAVRAGDLRRAQRPADPAWQEWTDSVKIEARIARFKQPLFRSPGSETSTSNKRDPLAFLIVKSMLLTGFDAPVEQAVYLDRIIIEAELLQAIARVNRT